MKELALKFNTIVLDVQLSGSSMNDTNNQNKFFKNIFNFFSNNLKYILIGIGILFLLFIIIQTYSYFQKQELKKTSIKFFNLINIEENIFENMNDIIIDNKNIFSTLSTLKLIQKNNDNNDFSISNDLYKKIIISPDLDNLYKSIISAHAAYTLIDASYIENTTKYFSDLSYFKDNISDKYENLFSIKKEIEYLLIVVDVDINKLDYKTNLQAFEIYNEIIDSSLISSSVKERVKKIHDFQLYK